jgi:hypothetical protein
MTDPSIQALEQKLDEVSTEIKECRDPYIRRTLLIKMRRLMAELDRYVSDPSRLHAAKPDPPKQPPK